MRPARKPKSEILTPGDVAVASTSAMSCAAANRADLSDRLGWQRGVLVFRNMTLAEAAAEFNRYNREQIVIADPKVAGSKSSAHSRPMIWRCSRVPRTACWACALETQNDYIVISR